MDLIFDTKKKIILVTLGTLIITYFIGHNFIYGINAEKAKQLEKRKDQQEQIRALMIGANNLQQKVQNYLNMRTDPPDPSSFSAKISDAVSACGIKVDSVSPGNSITEGPYTFLPCKISFTAPYEKLKAFIGGLERNEKFIRIESLSVAPVKVAKKETAEYASAGYGPPGGELIRKSQTEGIWVNVKMEVSGFYAD